MHQRAISQKQCSIVATKSADGLSLARYLPLKCHAGMHGLFCCILAGLKCHPKVHDPYRCTPDGSLCCGIRRLPFGLHVQNAGFVCGGGSALELPPFRDLSG